jgi:deoxyribose-phosphate aldolase
MVINIGRLLDGDYDYVKKDIQAVVEAAHRKGVLVKVIFENYYLTDEQKKVACRLSEEAGVDFVKTSTGFADGGATLEDLQLMRDNVSEKVQVKAAGGVRDLEMALKVRQVGCTRFGATRTETIMEQCHERRGTRDES